MATNLWQASQEDERRKAAALGQPRPNSFGDASAAARNPGMAQVGAAPVGPQPAAPSVAPPANANSAPAQISPSNIFPQGHPSAGRNPYVSAPVPPTAAQALGQMHNPNPRTGAQMLASGLDSGARAFFDSFGPSPDKPAPAALAPTAANPTDQRLAAGTQAAPMGLAAAAKPAPASPAATALQTMPGVYQHGRGQFSDSAEGMGFKPGFTGQPNAQNLAAGENLSQGNAQRSLAAAAAPQAAGFTGVTAPSIQHSGNSWQAANDLRNARVSASSITANGGRFDQTRKGQMSPQAATYAAMLGTDQALRQAQPGMAQAAMRENADIQREGIQQDGATQRAGLGFQTAQQRLAMERETQGFANRAAQQSEQLRNTLLDPNATPEQRRIAQRSLAALSGKTAADRMQTVTLPDTTNEMGQVVRGGQALVRTLEDGTVEQVPIGRQGGQGQQLPTVNGPDDLAKLPKGAQFIGPDGKTRIKN